MPDTAYPERILALIESHGQAVQPVLGDAPCVPDFAYTIGLRSHGLPELIVFALHPQSATRVLDQVADRLRVGTLAAEPGVTIHGLSPSAQLRARLGEVRPEWARRYGLAAHSLAQPLAQIFGYPHDESGVPFLQVLVSDARGRLPGQSGYDQRVECLQPLLSRTVPFVRPLHAHPRQDRFADPRAGDVWLAVPIYERYEPEGRYELLRGTQVGEREVELVGAPWQADHVTTGDRVSVRPATSDDGRLPALTVVAEHLSVRGPNEHLVFLFPHHYPSADLCTEPHPTPTGPCRHAEVHRQVRRLLASGLVAAAADSHTRVHVATSDPEAVRQGMRPLLRDGALVEEERHSAARSAEPPSDEWPA